MILPSSSKSQTQLDSSRCQFGIEDSLDQQLLRERLRIRKWKKSLQAGLRTGVLAALQEDWSSVPSTDMGQLTTTSNSSSRESVALFWPPQGPALTCAHKHTHKINL